MRGSVAGAAEGIPGEVLLTEGPVWINAGRPTITLTVVNAGDRPVQVGSHYHLAEANPALRLDRAAAWGHRLDILAGSAVRFEPGATVEVTLVPIGGVRVVRGLRGECGGRLDEPRGEGRAGTPGATALGHAGAAGAGRGAGGSEDA